MSIEIASPSPRTEVDDSRLRVDARYASAPFSRSAGEGKATPPRARGEIRADFVAHGAHTRVGRLYETGGLRLRFPKARDICEGVIVNTAGGVVGGDHARLSFAAGPGARVALTTQSAEKIYRTDGPPARIETSLKLESGAALDWLPQETILFNRASLVRSLDVDMAADATLVACESVVFGRQAMGETCVAGDFRDRWRVRRAGKLIFAEDARLAAPAALLERPAIGGGARALATLLHVAPDALARLDECRAALADSECESGVSALDGFLVARLLSPSPENLRLAILRLFSRLLGRAAPRVWQ
ncbi:MAG TPA: urease accessory protein UreD [Rhodoblastus sp.]|nr:urease accessory protein UreD [Rhodoblastus sp.]